MGKVENIEIKIDSWKSVCYRVLKAQFERTDTLRYFFISAFMYENGNKLNLNKDLLRGTFCISILLHEV